MDLIKQEDSSYNLLPGCGWLYSISTIESLYAMGVDPDSKHFDSIFCFAELET